MYDIYLYDTDTGNYVGIIATNVEEAYYKVVALKYHVKGYAVKVVDTFDGVVVYTLG